MFQSIDHYPELHLLRKTLPVFRREALAARSEMIRIADERAAEGDWMALPILPEVEDRARFDPAYLAACRELGRETFQSVREAIDVQAVAFSLLSGGGRIHTHHHHQPYVTASLCLECEGESWIEVEDDRRDYRVGEWIVFDYRQRHGVVNNSTNPRVVLLLALENRCG